MVGLFLVRLLIVRASAFLLARRRLFSDEIRFSFIFVRCAIDLSISVIASPKRLGKGIHGGISQYGDYRYKALRSDYIHFIISI